MNVIDSTANGERSADRAQEEEKVIFIAKKLHTRSFTNFTLISLFSPSFRSLPSKFSLCFK